MNPRDFLPKDHPLKKFFKQIGYPFGAVSQYLDLSYSYVSNILSGRMTPTPEVEAKLQKLADELRKSGGAK